MSQALCFKSSSGDPATESSILATWCHTAPGSASTAEVYLPLRCPREVPNCSIPLPGEGGQRGWSWATGSRGNSGWDKRAPSDTVLGAATSADEASRLRGSFATRKQTGWSRDEGTPQLGVRSQFPPLGQILSKCWHIRVCTGFA